MHLLYNRGNIRKGTLYKKESENDIDHNKRNIYRSKKYEIGGEKEMYYVLQYIKIISFW